LKASVTVDEKKVGVIGSGALIFVGITQDDTKEKAHWLARKFVSLRMFSDEEGKLNRSILDCQGEALIVSQFTLYADCSGGRRPSFIGAAPPEVAEPLYKEFIEEVKKQGLSVETGVFGAMMDVSLVNSGPMTLILER